jgi:hypothetical protein
MRKEAKEFRAKNPLTGSYHKSQSMKLPDVPIPQSINLNTQQLRLGNFGPLQFPQASNPVMDVNQFEQNMAQDQNLQILYNQFVIAYTEGKISNPPTNGKHKTNSSNGKPSELEQDKSQEMINHSQLLNNSLNNYNSNDDESKDSNVNGSKEVERENKLLEQGVTNQISPPRYTMSKNKINHDNLNPNFNKSENRYDHPRPSNSARNSRQNSKNGSKNNSRQGSAMKGGNGDSAKGNNYNRSKQNSYQYKPRKLSQNYNSNREAEVMLVQEKRPHKRDNSNLKFTSIL